SGASYWNWCKLSTPARTPGRDGKDLRAWADMQQGNPRLRLTANTDIDKSNTLTNSEAPAAGRGRDCRRSSRNVGISLNYHSPDCLCPSPSNHHLHRPDEGLVRLDQGGLAIVGPVGLT